MLTAVSRNISPMTVFCIYSSGGFAREVKRSLQESKPSEEIVFIDDDPARAGTVINGARVCSYAEVASMEAPVVNVALADPALRRQKMLTCQADDIELFSIVSSTTVIGENVSIGPGAVLAEYSMITADATIGTGFHCNIYSYVAHDCIIGDYVTFAPRVSLNGRINVGNNVYVGSDATFLPGQEGKPLVIGDGAVVGAGAVVTKNVEPGTVVVGSPAKPLVRG